MTRRWKLAGAVMAGGCLIAGAAGLGHPLAAHSQPPPAKLSHRSPVTIGKGVGTWVFDGVNKALVKSGASWYYTWAPDHRGIATPPSAAFVPMIQDASEVTPATLRQVAKEGPDLLGFNEPDVASESDMTVSQALRLWPKLMSTGLRLGSPAVATGDATAGGWLDRFMRGARAHHYRVNFIALHWYGADFATRPAVRQLRSYLQAVYARYRLPVWLTEFALIRYSPAASFPSPRRQAAFLTAATSMLGQLSYVRRYAWFALPTASFDGTAGLFRPGAIATRAGRAFEAAGPAATAQPSEAPPGFQRPSG